MITVFIDESGNLGRGGRYFVLAAVVFDDRNSGSKRIKRLVKRTSLRIGKAKYGKPLEELKARDDLSFVDRQRFLQNMAKRPDHEIFYFIADKKHVSMLQQGKPKNLAYNFFSGLLAREIAKKYPTQDISILFDERTTKVASMNSLSDYIRIKLYTMVGFYGNITVDQANSKSSLGLQAADVISNTIYQSIKSGKQHFLKIIESRIESRQHFPQGKFGK
jgi:hypothetical protein